MCEYALKDLVNVPQGEARARADANRLGTGCGQIATPAREIEKLNIKLVLVVCGMVLLISACKYVVSSAQSKSLSWSE